MGTEPLALDPAVARSLARTSTATLTTVLLKKGLRNVWMRGTRPISPGYPRIVNGTVDIGAFEVQDEPPVVGDLALTGERLGGREARSLIRY